MFDDRNLLELIDLPSYGSFPLRGLGNVSDVEQPVREVEAVASIKDGRGLTEPVGGIYSVQHLDGSKREIFAWLNSDWSMDFKSAIFLKAGRQTDQLSEVRQLMIPESQDAVPEYLKYHLSVYQQKCNDSARQKYEQAVSSRLING